MKMAIPFLLLAAGALLMYAGINDVSPVDSIKTLFSQGKLPGKDEKKDTEKGKEDNG